MRPTRARRATPARPRRGPARRWTVSTKKVATAALPGDGDSRRLDQGSRGRARCWHWRAIPRGRDSCAPRHSRRRPRGSCRPRLQWSSRCSATVTPQSGWQRWNSQSASRRTAACPLPGACCTTGFAPCASLLPCSLPMPRRKDSPGKRTPQARRRWRSSWLLRCSTRISRSRTSPRQSLRAPQQRFEEARGAYERAMALDA